MSSYPISNVSDPVGRDLQASLPRGLAAVGGYPAYPAALSAPNALDDEDVIDLREYWRMLVRRRWTIISVAGIAVVAALIATFLTTPVYRASVLLQIERESSKVVEYETVMPENTGDNKDFYQTQYELLHSRSLARRVVDQLGLRSSDTFAPVPDTSFLDQLRADVTRWFTMPARGDQSGQGEPLAPDIETAFLRNLTVEPVKNSRLVTVHFNSPVPAEAATIANAVAENFVNTSLERRYEAASYAKKFLTERIELARANLDDSERRLIAYAREREIVNLDDKLGILMARLKDLSAKEVAVEAERIAAEAVYQVEVKEGGARTSGALKSTVIDKLKDRLTELTAQYQEQLKVFKPAYPKMQRLQQQINEVQRNLDQELKTIGSGTRVVYEAKGREEAKLLASINAVKAEILNLQDRSTDYQTLKRDVDTNRQLFDGLLQRMKEIGVVAGIGTNNISVIDPAEVPRSPFKPSLKKNLLIALALGLFGGIALAFLFETLDDTIKSSEELERRLDAPILGMVPWVTTNRDRQAKPIGMLVYDDPKSELAEAYRSLRTALIFATAAGAPRVLHFASPSAGEGKSTSASSTAITFAQSGSKVLLIDCDLRNPSQHKTFDLPNTRGLTSYLIGAADAAEIAVATEVSGLFVIPSGPLPPNPVELLSTARMPELVESARTRFDFVILDGPAILGLADALILANLARATVLVVESASTRIGALDGAAKRLRLANANILGAALVKHRISAGGYGYDYHYTYSYGGNERARLTGGSVG